jgi:hypothetical protein
MGPKLRLALLLAAALPALPAAALADANWKPNSAVWAQQDRCTAQAFKAFPDYTREGNASREKARQQCLRSNNMPAEGNSGPPPPVPGAPQPQPRQ